MSDRVRWEHREIQGLGKRLVCAIETNSEEQRRILTTQSKFLLAAGGFRSGKTLAMSIRAIEEALSNPGSTGVVFRSTYRRLEDATCQTFLHEALPEEWDNEDCFRKSEMKLTIPDYKSVILFRHLENDSEMRGAGWDWVFLDEANENSERLWHMIQGRMSGKKGIQRRLLTCNPNGHDWLWREFMKEKHADHETVIMPTYLNRGNLPPDYIENMERLYSGIWIRRFLGADFDAVASGLVYDELARDMHIIKGPWEPDGAWKVYAGLDWGFVNPTAWVLVAVQGPYAIVFREHKEADLTPLEIAKALRPLVKHYQVEAVFCDTSMRLEIKKILIEQGIPLKDSTQNRENHNIMCVKQWLRPLEGRRNLVSGNSPGPALYFVEDRTSRLIGEAREYMWQEQPDTDAGEKAAPEKPRKVNDHLCVAEGTLIAAEHGQIPIENIHPGDCVWTRKGLCRVLAKSRSASPQSVMTLRTASGRELRATGNHPVWTGNRGWISMDTLEYSDTLLSWNPKQSCSMASNSDAIPSPNGDRIVSITGHTQATSGRESSISTRRFGRTASVQFQPDTTSTTRTAIHSTTTSQIWKPSTGTNISVSTTRGKQVRQRKPTSSAYACSLQSGTEAGRAAAGTISTPLTYSKSENQFQPHAVCAGKHSTTGAMAKRCAFVEERAIKRTGAQPILDTTVVFNVLVEDAHEYFANGTLVSNCDALGYAASGIHLNIPRNMSQQVDLYSVKSRPRFFVDGDDEDDYAPYDGGEDSEDEVVIIP